MQNLNTFIDHTLLKPEATKSQIVQLCKEAKTYNMKAVCVNPHFIATAAGELFGSETKVCTVIGFPLGTNQTETKVFETEKAIEAGADEIDMVLNIGELIDNNLEFVKSDIEAVLKMTHKHDKLLKVIFETSKLSNDQIVSACKICKELKVDFVKTSTGFGGGGATLEHVKLMRDTVGSEIGVKASGGVRDTETAIKMIEAGATRIGTSSSLIILGQQ
tara:strand:+ start:44206 stop:44859 length:654 start_codon:yes stop_codon:yes gene_type:complete